MIWYSLPDDGSIAIFFRNQILSFHPFFSLLLFSLTGRRYIHLQQRAFQTTSHTRVHENLADSQPAGGVSVFVPLHVFTFCGRGRDVGGAHSFWPWYYKIILYTIIYRTPGVTNGNNHFLLHAAVHPGLHCTEFDGWTLIGCLRYTCHSVATLLNADWLSSREIKIHFNSSEFLRATNPRERARLCTAKVWRE